MLTADRVSFRYSSALDMVVHAMVAEAVRARLLKEETEASRRISHRVALKRRIPRSTTGPRWSSLDLQLLGGKIGYCVRTDINGRLPSGLCHLGCTGGGWHSCQECWSGWRMCGPAFRSYTRQHRITPRIQRTNHHSSRRGICRSPPDFCVGLHIVE